MLARRRRHRGLEEAIARTIFIGQDIEVAVVGLGEVKKILTGCDRNDGPVRLHILEVDFVFRPALLNHDGEPAPVIRKNNAWPILWIAAFPEDERILRRFAPQRVIEDVPVVHLLAFGHVALLRIARVVEAAVVRLPRDAGRTRAFNDVGQQLAGRGLDDVQRAHLGATLRRSVRDILSVVRHTPPVERRGAVLGKLIGVHQHFVLAIYAFAHVEHGLVLLAVAAGVEVIIAADLRLAEVANLQQLLDAIMQLLAAGQLVEDAARVRQLSGDPLLCLGRAAILQPAVGIDNLLAKVVVGHGLLLGFGWLRDVHRGRRARVVVLRGCGRAQQEHRAQHNHAISDNVV